MAKRGALFAAWAGLGLVLSYGATYAFTPFGAAIIAASLVVATVLPKADSNRWPDVLGLVAGVGLFCWTVALANGALGWALAGAVLIGAAFVGWLIAADLRFRRTS